ncbi:tetratricopeptide repeat protein [Streptomyces sp. NPDC058746]|uniref:tetratricopeptide repeat protein n=1 Tax=Streptomyces sp. NPDC058746 TaxID=3346622 RepID=UPI0036B4A761
MTEPNDSNHTDPIGPTEPVIPAASVSPPDLAVKAAADGAPEAQAEVDRCRQAGDRPGLARALIFLSVHLQNARRYEEAIAAANEGVTIHRDLSNELNLAWGLENLAARYANAGRHEESLPPARERVDILRRLNRRPDLANALIVLSAYLQNARRYEEAIAAANEGVTIHRELSNELNLAWGLENLAARYANAGRHEESLPPARERVDILRRLNRRPDLANALIVLSAYLQNTRHHEEAIAAGREGTGIFREFGSDAQLAWGLANLRGRYAAAPDLKVMRAVLYASPVASGAELLHGLIQELRLDTAGGVRVDENGVARVEAYADGRRLAVVRSRGATVEVTADATETGLARQDEVGRGNRFADGGLPAGVGILVEEGTR